LELTVEEHLEIWESAPDRLLSASPHAALVVSMHGASLSELRLAGGRGGGQELQRHIDAEVDRQMRLRAKLGLGEHEAALIRRLMWTWDGLSLALCNGWDPFTARDVPAQDEQLRDLELRGVPGDGILELEPWPFSRERVELRCAARRLAAPYEDEAEMQRALHEAELVTLQFTLVSRTTTG
jgi:hypothetical protein